MELQFEKTVCRCLRQILHQVQNQEQTQELRLPDGLPDIGRVLGAWGQVIVRSKEWHDDMRASGGVMGWVMYAPEDGSRPRCVEVWIPFQMKWDLPDASMEGRMVLTTLLRYIDARTISARKLMVRAGIGILGQALVNVDAEVYQPGEVPEDVELLRHTYPIKLPREACEKAFTLDEDLVLPSSCPVADKILRFEILPQILDQKVLAGRVVFRGNALLHVLYRCEDGEMASWDFEIPFSQFGDLEETFGQNAAAQMNVAVTAMELDLIEDGKFRLKCGLVGQYVVSDDFLLELTEDAYSPHRDVTLIGEKLMLPSILDERTEMIHGELEMEGGKVVDVSFLPDFPRCYREGDCIRGELTGIFQVLYTDGEGNIQCSTARWENPFAMPVEGEEDVYHTIALSVRPQAMSNGGSVVVKGSVALTSSTSASGGMNMVTGVEIGEIREPDPGRPSLILRRCDGESLWNLAKRYGSTISAILQANQLTEEPKEGEMILIPVT